MTIFRNLLASALTLVCATGAAAQGYSPGENLIVDIPPGFGLVTQTESADSAIEEYIPQNQTLQTWSDLITLQVFPGLGGTGPDAFLDRMAGAVAGECPGAEIGSVQPVGVGAYPSALFVVICPDSPRTEGIESFAAYAIGGLDRLYVVQYAWDRRPSPDDIAAAQMLFAGVLLCDTRRADASCPAP